MKSKIHLAALVIIPVLAASCGASGGDVIGVDGPRIAARYKVEKQDKMQGFTRTVFEMDGCVAWVVEPDKPASDGRWVWCMEWPTAFQDRTGVKALLSAGYRWVTIPPPRRSMPATRTTR